MIKKNYLFSLILIFLLLIIIPILFEIGFGVGRLIIGKDFKIPYFLKKIEIDSPNHPCNEMKTDTFFGHVKRSPYKCKPLGGSALGEYVDYEFSKNDKPVLITLGGSTTSGFYQFISNGETYPYWLAKISKNDYRVINGGIGAYSSSNELFKFIRDGSLFRNLKVVISLNGINDLPGYGGEPRNEFLDYPFLTDIQLKMNRDQIWIDQRISLQPKDFFPNTKTLIDYFVKPEPVKADGFLHSKKKINTNEKKDDTFNFVETADKWEKNIKRLRELVKLENAEYFVFLQPTMGLKGSQSEPLKDSNDEKVYKQWLSFPQNENYLERLQSFYDELKDRCKNMPYCYDISDSVPPIGDVYFNMRHHNSKGNRLLAEKIWSILSKN